MQPCNRKTGVLVVDDDPAVRAMVQLALERHDFEVWAAGDGLDALRLYRIHSERVALVLLDVQMPMLDGPHTLDALRVLNPNVIACFMSGSTGQYSYEDLNRRGPAAIIAKPFRLDDLASQVRLLTQGASAVGSHDSR